MKPHLTTEGFRRFWSLYISTPHPGKVKVKRVADEEEEEEDDDDGDGENSSKSVSFNAFVRWSLGLTEEDVLRLGKEKAMVS